MLLSNCEAFKRKDAKTQRTKGPQTHLDSGPTLCLPLRLCVFALKISERSLQLRHSSCFSANDDAANGSVHRHQPSLGCREWHAIARLLTGRADLRKKILVID